MIKINKHNDFFYINKNNIIRDLFDKSMTKTIGTRVLLRRLIPYAVWCKQHQQHICPHM